MKPRKQLLGQPPHRAVDEWMLGDRGHPLCYDSAEQYENWAQAADAATDAEVNERGICADCTLLYRNQMINAGRCSRVLVPFARHQPVASATLRTTAAIAATPEKETCNVD